MIMEKAIKESLVYDRANSRLRLFIADLSAKQREDDKVDLENGEPLDQSYDILLKDLKTLQSVYNTESQRLWNMAEQKAEWTRHAVENLANAIVQRAVEDYEMAISGVPCEDEITSLERFADNCDQGEYVLTKARVHDLLALVRKGHKQFVKYANENGKEIIAETKRIRSKHGEITDSRYRCPMCGGALYTESQCGVHRVVCTGCYLSEVVQIDKKKVGHETRWRGYD